MWLIFLLYIQIVLAGPSLTQAPEQAPLFTPTLPQSEANWILHTGPYADVYTTAEDQKLGLHLARHAAVSIPRIATELGVSSGGPIKIYVTPTNDDFFNLQPHAPPAWADATAWPNHGLIF